MYNLKISLRLCSKSSMHIFICTLAANHKGFRMYFCFLLLSMTLFVSHLVPPCEISEGIYFVSLAVTVLLSICPPLLV